MSAWRFLQLPTTHTEAAADVAIEQYAQLAIARSHSAIILQLTSSSLNDQLATERTAYLTRLAEQAATAALRQDSATLYSIQKSFRPFRPQPMQPIEGPAGA
eukprot:11175888-Alexandrium_andersonii.AAC.1